MAMRLTVRVPDEIGEQLENTERVGAHKIPAGWNGNSSWNGWNPPSCQA